MSSFPPYPSGHPPTLRVSREPANLADALREAQALVGRHDPELGQPYLARVSETQVLAQGSAAPLLGLVWQQLPFGLLVPADAATAPAPIDQMKAYLTAEEVFGFAVDGEWIRDQLQRLPLEEVLTYAATFLNLLRRPGADRTRLDREYVGQYLRGRPQTRALNLLRDPHRVLLIPQSFYVLAKLACAVSPARVPDGTAPGNLGSTRRPVSPATRMIDPDQGGADPAPRPPAGSRTAGSPRRRDPTSAGTRGPRHLARCRPAPRRRG